MPASMSDLIRNAANRNVIADVSTESLRQASNRNVVGDGPNRDGSGRFAPPSSPLEAFAQAHGAKKPALIARLIGEPGADPADLIAALKRDHADLFNLPSYGSADAGARGEASTPAFDPISEYRRSVGLL